MSDNVTRQAEEVEAVSSIYGDDWRIEDEAHRSYSIIVREGEINATLYIKMPPDYPSCAPPSFQISAPEMQHSVKERICAELNSVYLDNLGEAVIFAWAEKLREILQEMASSAEMSMKKRAKEKAILNHKMELISQAPCITEQEIPEIIHGNTITDRKSVFQGHAVAIEDVGQVKKILDHLYTNKKIANATHNIYAYRIFKSDTNSYLQECEDDGESQAGGKLLRLLQILDVKNVLVVVSRWYGGIHLGPDRFRHINNAARQVLSDAHFISEKQ